MTRKPAVSFPPTIATSGEIFADGKLIELVRDVDGGQLELLLSDGINHQIAPQIDNGGQTYVPLRLDPALLQAMVLPRRATEYGSTSQLFASTRGLFTGCGFADVVASAATYVSFATWFPECFGAAPLISISGPRPEASLFLQLFSCVIRRPLRVIEASAATLASIPWNLQPTLLIDHESVSRSRWRWLSASNTRPSLLSRFGKFINAYSAKIIYVGLTSEVPCDGITLKIHLTPLHEKRPILRPQRQEELVEKFQPQYLMYRLRNIGKVRTSDFDLPDFSSESRVRADVLGRCIVDAPELQKGIRSLLMPQEENSRVLRFRDPRCAVIEATLDFCHMENQEKVHVGKIAAKAKIILLGRGQATDLSDNEAGDRLRDLGFEPKRDNKGYGFPLTDDIRRKIHIVARDHRVPAAESPVPDCVCCQEIFKPESLTSK